MGDEIGAFTMAKNLIEYEQHSKALPFKYIECSIKICYSFEISERFQ
jgi:hypothetical protein